MINIISYVFIIFVLLFVSATPILKIVQLILNEDALYHTILKLPVQQNVLTAVGTIFSHSRFKEIEGENILVFLNEKKLNDAYKFYEFPSN